MHRSNDFFVSAISIWRHKKVQDSIESLGSCFEITTHSHSIQFPFIAPLHSRPFECLGSEAQNLHVLHWVFGKRRKTEKNVVPNSTNCDGDLIFHLFNWAGSIFWFCARMEIQCWLSVDEPVLDHRGMPTTAAVSWRRWWSASSSGDYTVAQSWCLSWSKEVSFVPPVDWSPVTAW